MPATWLTVLSWTVLAGAFVSAAWILIDTFAFRHRQQMPIMEAVWPITALYFGPAAICAYNRFGRPMSPRWRRLHQLDDVPNKPDWASSALGVSHCGAGCTLGDIVAEFAIFALGASIAGVSVYAEMLGDYFGGGLPWCRISVFRDCAHAGTQPTQGHRRSHQGRHSLPHGF